MVQFALAGFAMPRPADAMQETKASLEQTLTISALNSFLIHIMVRLAMMSIVLYNLSRTSRVYASYPMLVITWPQEDKRVQIARWRRLR
jgi:hypothetical protein